MPGDRIIPLPVKGCDGYPAGEIRVIRIRSDGGDGMRLSITPTASALGVAPVVARTTSHWVFDPAGALGMSGIGKARLSANRNADAQPAPCPSGPPI